MVKSKDLMPDNFNSIEEIQDFWDKHSTADYWDEMKDANLHLSKKLKSKIEQKKLYSLLRLSKKQIATIENFAQDKKMDSKQLISKWILEHV